MAKRMTVTVAVSHTARTVEYLLGQIAPEDTVEYLEKTMAKIESATKAGKKPAAKPAAKPAKPAKPAGKPKGGKKPAK